MIKRHLFLILVSLVTALAFILRMYQLGSVPSSPNWDEVALGYNALSILETGRDEYGKFLPVVLRSYDDYKPALYTYLVIPSYIVFGLSAFSVRLPSAIFGTLAVLATYFLVIEIIGKSKLNVLSRQIDVRAVALVSAFLLSISPWHLQFSRVAFESNVGVAFNIFGALFFLKALKGRFWYLILSAVFFALNPSIYQSDKVFTPLLFFMLLIIFWREFWRIKKVYIVSSLLVGAAILLPMISFHLTDSQALARASGVSVISDQTNVLKQSAEKLQIDREKGDYLGLVLDNRRVEFVKLVVAGYLSHFDLNWLFINGDIARHHAPNMGLLYLFELPFLLIGIYQVVFGNLSRKTKLVILGWFLLAPVPAMITSGVPHAVRTLNFLPMFQVFVAFGLVYAFLFIERFRREGVLQSFSGVFIYFIFLGAVSFNITFYLNQYFVQQNYETSKDWLYGYENAVQIVNQHEGKFDKIIVSNQPPLDQSYMFFLFYNSYPPKKYQSESQDSSGGFRENHIFGKYEFRPLGDALGNASPNFLYVGRPSDFPAGIETLGRVNYLDGTPAIFIVSGKSL